MVAKSSTSDGPGANGDSPSVPMIGKLKGSKAVGRTSMLEGVGQGHVRVAIIMFPRVVVVQVVQRRARRMWWYGRRWRRPRRTLCDID